MRNAERTRQRWVEIVGTDDRVFAGVVTIENAAAQESIDTLADEGHYVEICPHEQLYVSQLQQLAGLPKFKTFRLVAALTDSDPHHQAHSTRDCNCHLGENAVGQTSIEGDIRFGWIDHWGFEKY